MNANDHYDRLYGDLGLSPQDAARWVFASGWNSALEEFMKRLNAMLLRIKHHMIFKALDKVSPLSVAVIVEIGRESVYGEAAEYILAETEDELLKTAMS